MSVSCLRCGYDLRATPPQSPCPECGLAAHRSVIAYAHPDDCQPGWVRAIAVGSWLLLTAYCGAALLLLNLVLILDGVWSGPNSQQMNYVAGGAQFLLMLVHAAGCYLITIREKARKRPILASIAAVALRLASLPPIAAVALAAALSWMPTRSLMQFAHSIDIDSLLQCLVAPLMICPPLTFLRFRQLALRLSRPRLAEHVTIVAAGSAVSLVVLALSIPLRTGVPTGSNFALFMTIVVPSALVCLFNLWALLLLFIVVQKFTQSAGESHARWRAADASVATS
jgi:hypothetical protein